MPENQISTKRIISVSIVGVITIVALVALVFLVPDSTEQQWQIIRVAVALGGAAFAAMLPGTISTNFHVGVGAAGSLAVFVIIFYSIPQTFVADAEVSDEVRAEIRQKAIVEFIKSLPFDEEVNTMVEAKASVENLVSEKNILKDKLKQVEMKESVMNELSPNNILTYIEKLNIDNDEQTNLVQSLRLMSINKLGAWKPSSKAIPVKISVPGNFDEGKNYGCPNRFNGDVEFSSNLYFDDEHFIGQPSVVLPVNGLMSTASNCSSLYKHDFQLSCIDAIKIFSSKVLKCDNSGNPLWKIRELKRILPAFAIQK